MTGLAGTDKTNRNEILLIVMALYLIGTLIYRVLVPAHSYPLRHMQLMTMTLDLGVIVGLFGLKSKLTTMRTLFWVALGCGIGLFAIRLTSEAGWWTGHLIYRWGGG